MSSLASPAVAPREKLFGRPFYESIGSPKLVLAPMVDQSEFAWRMLTRSFLPSESSNFLAYTPMLHSRLFADTAKYREHNFEPLRRALPAPGTLDTAQVPASEYHLDGNPAVDRPLFVQFCSNSPKDLLAAARYVEPFCDAVDLNLGCPQGIARKGKYGAFLQEDWRLIHSLINTLHKELSIPVTAKMRVLETKEKTLEYAKMLLSAGASIITVHGRQREQKGHNTGLADWSVIRYLRDSLPKDTVIFANGNILQHGDIEECLRVTGADGVMSAEGNLCDPTIFATPPEIGQEGHEYWRGRDGRGGYRMDAVLRRYLDIVYTYVLGRPPPARPPLFVLSDLTVENNTPGSAALSDDVQSEEDQPPNKKQRIEEPLKQTPKEQQKNLGINLRVMQPHLFHLLRPLVAKHTDIRDALAKSRASNIQAFERVLQMVEAAVKQGLIDYETETKSLEQNGTAVTSSEIVAVAVDAATSSQAAVERCRRPWFICQSYVRPLPAEAIEKGAMTLSKKEKARLEQDDLQTKKAGLTPGGTTHNEQLGNTPNQTVEVAQEGLVCG